MAPAHPPGHDVSSYSSDNKTQSVAPALPPAAADHRSSPSHDAWHLHAHVAMAGSHTHPRQDTISALARQPGAPYHPADPPPSHHGLLPPHPPGYPAPLLRQDTIHRTPFRQAQ